MSLILHVTGLDDGKVSALASNGFSDAAITREPDSDRGVIEVDVEPADDAAVRELVAHAEALDGVHVEHVEQTAPTFNDLLARHLDGLDSYVAAVEAERFRDWMATHHPDVLDAWRHAHEVEFIRRAIVNRDARDRSKARRRAKARQFSDAADKAEQSGDTSGLDAFAIPYVVDEEDTRKRVGDMTGPDHKFVASQYGASAKKDLMLEQFHLAVAKKVGKRRTRDVLSPEQYSELYRSIAGGDE